MTSPNPLQPVHEIPLFPLSPTLGSLQAVMELGTSQLPITSRNELAVLLMTYHNTLLELVRTVPEQVPPALLLGRAPALQVHTPAAPYITP